MQQNRVFRVGRMLTSGLAAISLTPCQLSAQDAPEEDTGGLEEIVVTAQKREQSLQDVPVAVTAITEQSIQVNRITSVQDLSGLAPNLVVRAASGGSAIPSFGMRGITSFGVVPGSDKQVSINLDGVYLSASRGALFELPDIARIEVLRGPQGTLFGRNATAGAVSIITKDPDGDFGVKIEVGLGNYDQRRIRASIDLPQIGPFSAYVSFVHNERRGDIRNLGAGQRWDRTGMGTVNVAPRAGVPDFSLNGKTFDTNQPVQFSPKFLGNKNVETYFAALKFEPSDRFRAVYKYDLSIDNSTPEGVGTLAINDNLPTSVDLFSGAASGAILGAVFRNADKVNGPFGPIVLTPDGSRPKAVNNNFTTPSFLKNYGHTLTATYNLTDDLSIKNIAAYRRSYLGRANSHFAGLGGLYITPGAQADIRRDAPAIIGNAFATLPPAFVAPTINGLVASFPLGTPFVTLGTNIENLAKQWSNELQVNYDSDFVTLTVGGIYFHSTDRSGPPQFIRGTASLTSFPITGEVPLGQRAAVAYNKATSIAGFAQAEFHITPKLDLVAGGRLTRDRKSGNFISGLNPVTGAVTGTFTSNVPGCPAGSNPVGACRLSGTYAGFFESPFNYRPKAKFIYSLGANYKPTDDILAYVKYSTGYVSGGSVGGIPFGLETVKSTEAGLKADFLDRRLRTNLALFYAKYKDVQSAQSGRNVGRPDLGTAIVPGFDEEAYGVEFEATAVPLDGLTLSGSLGYTHIEVSNVNPIILNGSSINTTPRLTSETFRQTGTPRWTANMAAQYETPPVFGEATIIARLDANWRSKLRTDPNRLRGAVIPGFGRLEFSDAQWLLNGRVALQNIAFGEIKAEIALWGRNLTDDDTPLSPVIQNFIASTNYQAARTYGVDVTFRY